MADDTTLEETVALLEATLDATHDGILVLDPHRRIIRFNRRFLEMFRVPPEIAGDGGDRIDTGPPRTRQRLATLSILLI